MNPSMALQLVGRPVAFYPSLSKHVGGIKACLFLCQLLYWSDKSSNPLGVYKSTDDWQEETGLSYREQSSARKELRKRGLIVETHKRLEHRIYYRIDFAVFDELLLAIEQNVSPPNAESAIRGGTKAQSVLTETTTETTTENKTHGASDDDAVRDGQPSVPAKPDRKRTTYPEEFEELWAAYPKRAGHDPKKPAFQAWTARQRDDGVSHEDMMAGVQRYAAYCRAEGMVNTRFVKQAQFFLGPNHPFADEWSPSQNRRPSMKSSFEDANYSGYDTATPDWLGGEQ